MSNDKTLADAQPGGRVRLEQEPRDHRWDDVGERCLDCGDKDWMGGACSGPRAPEIAAPWSPIGSAPNDGRPHIRGLWETSCIDGKPESREWRQYIGLINDGGEFVDPECGENFGWAADQFDAWMPVAAAPGAALSAQPSPGGQGASHYWPEVDRILVDAYTAGSEGDEFDMIAARNAIHAALGSLAARQPVGEQRAALWIQFAENGNIRFWTKDQDRALAESFLHARPLTAFYASPQQPAQAVDLGRIRATVQALLNWIDDWAETPEESGIDALEIEAAAVLDLIDSQAEVSRG